MTTKNSLRQFIRQIVRESWDEQYKMGSNEEDFGFDEDSKSLYEPKKTKKKIRNYLRQMGLLKRR